MDYNGKTVKTMEEWTKFADSAEKGGFEYFCKPGELVDDSIFDYFLNVLPPHRWNWGYLQVGEPYSFAYNPKSGREESTWTTFNQIDKGVYVYCGVCFTNDTKDASEYKNQ